MKTPLRTLLPAVLLALSCARDPAVPYGCSLNEGDLAITEVMANPNGTDTGNEWFEFLNTTGDDLDITDLTLAIAKPDGSSEKTHSLFEGTVPAGAYYVVGDFRDGPLPAWINQSYRDGLGALPNDGGKLSLRCGTKEIDSIVYGTAPSGASLSFDGNVTPDSTANDDATKFCKATSQYTDGELGTPGAANDTCAPVADPDHCLDGATSRAVVKPAAGDLVISEIMADPNAVGDDKGEWIELTAIRGVDLNGLQLVLGSSTSTLSNPQCMTVPIGGRALLAKSTDPAENGGLPTVIARFTLSLTNGGQTLTLRSGTTDVDVATYGPASSGVSLQLDPTKIDAASNDTADAFCAATTAMASGDKGTPGAANTPCGAVVTGTQCHDAGTGQNRDLVSPAAGDLVITEFMPNPHAVADESGEWVEVLAKKTVDLNGVTLVNEGTGTANLTTGTDCVQVQAGAYLLFARTSDAATNGGLPAVNGTFGFSLSNTSSATVPARAIALEAGKVEVDRITYTTSGDGVSTQLDANKLDAVSNDTAANFCAGTNALASGDKGTPGAANRTCP